MNGPITSGRQATLLGEYSAKLGDAVLRQRASEAELRARHEVELANRVKSEFLSNMSHELRTPLNTIIGFSKLIGEHDRRKIGDGDIVEYARMIQDAAGHLLTVINDILDISKLHAGKYSLDAREIELDELLLSAIGPLKGHAESAGVKLEHYLDDKVEPVRGDASKVRQAISNIISNAIKFTKPGGSVFVELAMSPEGGALISIRDTGIGMTEDEIHVALTPFGQADASHTRWREGTGLGLPIAKALIELHGGALMIESAKSMGTEVLIELPSRHFVSLVGTNVALREQAQISVEPGTRS